MAPTAQARRRRLGELLIDAGLLDENQLKTALNEQRKWGGRLGRTVVELGFTTEQAMVPVLAQQLNIQTVDLDALDLPSRVVEHLRLDLAERYGVFPLQADFASRTLFLATADPTNIESFNELEFATGLKVVPVVTTASSIDRAIRRYYFGEVSTAVLPRPSPGKIAHAQAQGDANREAPVEETILDLNELLGEPRGDASTTRGQALPLPRQTAKMGMPTAELETQLRREISVLREQVDALEEINVSQVRALRTLLELLIESGLLTRDEYLERLHRGD